VACAVRKAIEIGNPHVRILDDKTVHSFVPEIESSEKKNGKTINIMYLVEIATPWSYEDDHHSALEESYKKKVRKYQPVIADIERKRPGFKCIQASIIVSPTRAFYRESQEQFAKVSKLSRGKLAIHKRCIVDAAIQGAYEQWRQFGRKLALSAQLESLNPRATERRLFIDPEEAEGLGLSIMETCPEISDEVVVQTREDGDTQVVGRVVGEISPIELYEASVEENRARAMAGLPPKEIDANPDGHKGDEDDGHDAMFGPAHPWTRESISRGRLSSQPPNHFRRCFRAPHLRMMQITLRLSMESKEIGPNSKFLKQFKKKSLIISSHQSQDFQQPPPTS
jgi:hypothetical protein